MYETIRIVEELKPKYVAWENVKNLLSKKHRHNFDAYLETMVQLGYTNYYQILNAKDYGIPQNRERVFTISIRKDINKVFTFPPKQELKLKLKDMLEDEIDEKYYLSDKMIKYISTTGTANFKNPDCKINLDIARPLTTDQNKRAGTTNYLSDDLPNNYDLNGSAYLRNFGNKGKLQNKECCDTLTVSMGTGGGNVSIIKDYGLYGNKQAGSVYNKNGLCPTITTEASQNWNILLNDNPRIRKLTPKECWRLMGFDDKDFEKAAFKKETSYIEGDLKCNAKLKIVNENQRHLDMETYASCTTSDMLDMETPIRTKWKKSIENENNEKMQNVNIAIEMLDEVEQKKCVTNIIKCGENTEILYTLMEELDQHHMAIIELGKGGKANIEKYMKITLEENLNPMKLYTISTLIKQIIKSKIYTCITHKANIQGNIAIIEDCVKNLKIMKLLNLKMDYITRLNSDTMLYKQAGNSIVVNVIEAIYDNLLIDYK